MATPYEQQLLDAGVTPDQISSEIALGKGGLAHGSNVDQQDVAGFLAKYKPTAQSVYSPGNVQQTMTNPLPAPDYSDPYKLYDYFYNTPDVVAARNDVQGLNTQLTNFDKGSLANQNYFENQKIPVGVITGEQANDARLRAQTRQGLSADLLAKQSFLDTATQKADQKYQIAQGIRAQLQDLIVQTGGNAKISYADSYDTAVKKADKYMKDQAKKASDDAYKKELKAQLLSLGEKTSGSTKDLEKRLRKINKGAQEEAKRNADLDYKIKLKSLNSGSGSGQSTANSRLDELLSKAAQLPSGGREWAESVAKTYGVSVDSVRQATSRDGWEAAYSANAKPATQAELTNANYATRLQQSGPTIDALDNQIAGMSPLSYKAQTSLIGTIGNGLVSNNVQQYDQAKRDFINAVLRKESGAVISDSEFKNAELQYFAQPGDSPERLAQKKANRQLVTQNFINSAGSALKNAPVGGGGGSIRVLNVQTGEVGTIPQSEYDPSKYVPY